MPLLLFLFAETALAIPPGLGNWTVLQSDPWWVGCTPVSGVQWCRSEGEIAAPLDSIYAIVGNIGRYPAVFKRIEQADLVESDVAWIRIAMPFLLADRDYVARFTKRKDASSAVVDWVPAVSATAPPQSDAVRLPRAEGQWRLDAVGPARTRVAYTWNGDLGSDFPSWALQRAWVTQGAEVLTWIRDAVEPR